MFTINQGFDLNSPQFNFKRDYFANVADLKAAPETSFPDHFITNVAGVLYQLTKSNSVDATTGKWRKVQLGSDVDLSNYAQKSELNKYEHALKSISFNNNGQSITGTQINGGSITFGSIKPATSSVSGLMSTGDKAKLDGIAANANNYTLPIATNKVLGGIKIGAGLSTNSDGTVSVASNIEAGSVEWNNIKNKPNVAELFDENSGKGENINGVILLRDSNTSGSATIKYNGITVDQDNSGINSITVSADGIRKFVNGAPLHGKVFLTDGATEELTAISTEELNKILV